MAMPNVGDFFSEFFEWQIDLYHSAGYCVQLHAVRLDASPRGFRLISIAEDTLVAASHRIRLLTTVHAKLRRNAVLGSELSSASSSIGPREGVDPSSRR